MDLPLYQDPAESALWRVVGFGQERYGPGRGYQWSNAERRPRSTFTAQLTLEGRVALDIQDQRHIAEPGRLLLFRHGEDSRYGKLDRREPYACRWANLDGSGLADHLEAFLARHGRVVHTGDTGPIVEQLGQLIALADPAAATPRTTMAHAVHTLVMRLFEHAERRLHQRLSPVEQAVAMILENPCRPWSLKEVAAEVGVSREHLSRVFTEQVGRPPHQHLTEARVRRALRLLRDTDLPLGDVAEQCGFVNTHTLARHVRRMEGASPSAVRARR